MKNLVALLFILLFAGAVLQAQDSLQNLPSHWSLEECIAYAKKNNIQINSLRLTGASAEQDLIQSRSNRLPNLTGSVTQSLVNSNNTDPVVGGFQTQANFSSGYGVNSSVTLFNGGYLKNDIRSKELSLTSANLSVEQAANDVTLSITEAFLNILLARENIAYLHDVVTTSRAQVEQGRLRFDKGAISRKDYIQLEAQVAADNYSLVNAQNTYQLNIVSLKQLLQLPSSLVFDVAVPDSVQPAQAVVNLESAQATAQQNRPEVKNGEIGVQISETELQKIRAGRLPTISMGAGLSSGFSDNQASKYFSQLHNNFYQSLGVTVSIPIFSRKLNITNIAKSKIEIEQSKLQLLNTKTILDQQIEQAYINLKNAQSQYAAADSQRIASEQSYNITNEQLRLGAVTSLEVQQQKNLYVQALQAFVQAKYSAILYNKIYDFYTGVPVTF